VSSCHLLINSSAPYKMKVVLHIVLISTLCLSLVTGHGILLNPAARVPSAAGGTALTNTAPCGPGTAANTAATPVPINAGPQPISFAVTQTHGAVTNCAVRYASTAAGLATASAQTLFSCGDVANTFQQTLVIPSNDQEIGIIQWEYPAPTTPITYYYSCADVKINAPSASSSSGSNAADNGANSNSSSFNLSYAGHNPGSFTVAASIIGLVVVFGFFGILYLKSRGSSKQVDS